MGVLAVAIIAAAGIGALVVAPDDSAADEALFVLPAPVDGWRLGDGAVTEPDPDVPATDERFITDGSLYGIADGDGFDDLRSVARYPRSPLRGARWEPVVTSVGESYRRLDDSMTFAHEEYDGAWRVVSSPSDLVHAYAMLANDIRSEVLVAVFDPPDEAQIPDTSFTMTSPDGSTFTVQTTTGSPLFDAATFAERVEPVDISGTTGWAIISEENREAAGTVVTWAPESGRTISVRSSAPRAEVLDAARRLQPVSADEWTSSFSD